MEPTQALPATCGASSGPGCSKPESATPLTDALFAKCKARPTDGSGSRDGGWGAADIADFLRHSRKLEIALGMTTAALRDISGAKAADDVPLYAKSFELLGRIQGIASVALNSISTLNPGGLGTGHLVAGTQHNIVGREDSNG